MPNQYTQYQNMNALEKPFRQLIDLNVKTIQNLTYIKPNELLNPNKPEQLIEKNMEVMIENGHKALDYMQDMFDIMEKHWFSMSRQVMRQSQETMNQTQRTAQNNMNDLRRASVPKSSHSATKHSSASKTKASKKASHGSNIHSKQASSSNRSSETRK